MNYRDAYEAHGINVPETIFGDVIGGRAAVMAL